MSENQEVDASNTAQESLHKPGKKTIAERISEHHPDWPPLKLKFYFSSHGSDQDMVGMEKHLADADIYLYEDPVDDGFKQILQAIASIDSSQLPPDHINNMIDSYDWAKGTFWETIMRALYGKKKLWDILIYGKEILSQLWQLEQLLMRFQT